MRNAFELFAIQFVNYGILTLNYRSVATVSYVGTGLTDICAAALTFMSIQRVARASNRWERVMYIAGGVMGGLFALWLSTLWFDT